jgi:superfamily I DNA and/or RNA helicase
VPSSEPVRRLLGSSAAPLRVHRRCDSPMFEICNTIAYEGLMINGVRDRSDPMPGLPTSRWLDVPAADQGSHLQREEIRRLAAALEDLTRQAVKMSHVIAVSPFRAVANALSSLRADHPGLVAGTVHTAQGKEADVVFFVLGGNPLRPGAKKWASSAPNLVSVAVSRAKHRLFVIGDRTAWQKHPFFDELEQALERHGRLHE